MTISRRDGVAIVTIDNPPVNALDLGVRTALAAALTRLAEDGAVAAVVITGTGRTFVAGADIRELERAVWDHAVEPPDFHELLRLVEDLPQAHRDGDQRHGARGRPGAGHGGPLSGRGLRTPASECPRSISASFRARRARNG